MAEKRKTTCPMCGSEDVSYRPHAQAPSKDEWTCRKCGFIWFHYY